jgi:NitT/TauT family transport system substrate-binding protein
MFCVPLSIKEIYKMNFSKEDGKMRRSGVVFVLIIIAVLVGGFLTITQAQDKTYKIAMAHWIGFSPLNVADVKGFWKEQGINVQVINNADDSNIFKQFENKEIDIGIHMMGSWAAQYMKGTPLTIIAETDWSNGGDKIIAKKDLDIAQLKGKPIGTYNSTPAVTFLINKCLSEKNLKLSDVKLVEFATEPLTDNFISGRFQLIVNYDPQALRAEKSGGGKLVATSATYPGCIPEGMAVRGDIIKDAPKADLVKILKGWLKAVAWTQESSNWKEYVEILNSKTFEGEKPYSEEDIKGMVGAVKLHSAKESAERNKKDGGLYIYFKELREFLSGSGMLTKDYKPEDLFDNTAIMEAVQGG